MNWAVVGVGDITRKRVLAATSSIPRSRLHAIVTTHPERAREFGAPYGVEHYYTSLDQALADPKVEAVYVATPVFLHAPQSIAAMRAGRHVLCEKPTALNYEESVRMAKTADECGVKYGVAFYRPFYPKIQLLKQLIAEGVIGQPTLAEASYAHWWVPEAGHERRWFVEPEKSGGGPLPDVASHRIDLLDYLLGEVGSVYASIGNQTHSYPVEDSATLLLEYKSGVRAVVDVRWNSRLFRDELRVTGTDGELDLTPGNGPSITFTGADKTWRRELPPHDNLHYPMVENFVEAVLDGKELVSTGWRATHTDRVIGAAYESARTGTKICF